jgi:hypothetical protein
LESMMSTAFSGVRVTFTAPSHEHDNHIMKMKSRKGDWNPRTSRPAPAVWD